MKVFRTKNVDSNINQHGPPVAADTAGYDRLRYSWVRSAPGDTRGHGRLPVSAFSAIA